VQHGAACLQHAEAYSMFGASWGWYESE
jgi:hypothetical protein